MAGDRGAPTEDGELTEAQLQEAERLMNEMPRIDTALKTYLALRIAEVQTGTAAAAGANPTTLQGCARVFSRTLNALEPPSSIEWGLKYPQTEAEGGLDYMARIGQYKVVQALWNQARSKGQKPAQLLGRSSLQVMLPLITDVLLADVQASTQVARATEEQLHDFIDGFTAASVPQDGAPERDAEAQGPDSELVWSLDYRATIAARQLARKSEAAERVERQASAGDFVDELRAALAPPAGGSSSAEASSGVQIEEVD